MRKNYVFIDYENVQPAGLEALDKLQHYTAMVFVGANQTKVTFEVAAALQAMGGRGRYIKISSSGRDALDFHIAYYLGQLTLQEPDAYFHVISKDTGFDPLITHLRDLKYSVSRWKDVAEMSVVKGANAKSTKDKVDVIAANLKQRGAAKPRTVKTLSSTISSIFQRQLPEPEIMDLVRELQSAGVLSVAGTKVTYSTVV